MVLDVIENSDVAQALRQGEIQNLQNLIYRNRRMNRRVALKVVKSAPRYTETVPDETKLLQRLITFSTPPPPPTQTPPPAPAYTHAGRSHVISFWIISDTKAPMTSTFA